MYFARKYLRKTKSILGLLLLLSSLMLQVAFADDNKVSEDTIYLPIVTYGTNLQSANSQPHEDIVLDSYGRPVTPFDQLPPCTDEMLAKIDWKNLPPPDLKSPIIGCRALSTSVEAGDGPVVVPIPARDNKISAAQASSIARAYALNRIDCLSSCTSSNGVKSIEGNLSAKVPTITSGQWTNYSFGNRMHFVNGSTSITCQSGLGTHESNVSLGSVYGNFWGTAVTGNMRVFWEQFLVNNSCQGNLTNIVAPANTALFMILDRYDVAGSGHWRGRVWLGYYATIFDIAVSNVTNKDADYVEAGFELVAVNGDLSTVKVPLNFVHRLHLVYSAGVKPWYDGILTSPLQGKSFTVTESPWNVMDLYPGDYTAMSVEANQ